MANECTETEFLKSVETHQMTATIDYGLHRHIGFANPKTRVCQFGLVTWPGYLCIYGDMGEYVFSRLPDMFEFFRNDRGTKLEIHVGYWGEKCVAVDRHGSLDEYSPEKFRRRIKEWLVDSEAPEDVREAAQREVLSMADDGEHEAMRAALAFEHNGYGFNDFYEVNVREPSYRFVWCLYAIAWGIRQYDAANKQAISGATDVV